MDNSPENWEKAKRIKEEVKKAEQASEKEDKAKLAYLDPRSFSVGKGLSHNIEAYRVGSEKISGIALSLIILGIIADAIFIFITSHLNMGLTDVLPSMIDNAIYAIFIVAPAVASIASIIEAIIYIRKTGHQLTGPIVSSLVTILIFLVWQGIRPIIASI